MPCVSTMATKHSPLAACKFPVPICTACCAARARTSIRTRTVPSWNLREFRGDPISFARRISSFPVAICSLLGVLAVCTVRGRLDDPDLWLHLKTGEIVWNTHHVPNADNFSYTTGHVRTIPHEWLGQTSIFAAYHFGGYSGLMLWLCLAASAILIAGYALCSLYSGNAKVSLAGALLIWLFAMMGFSIRPQMLGYLLLIIELLIVHFGRTHNARWFFLLPPLFAVWVNLHGSFSLGLTISCILLLASFFSFQRGLLQA